VAFYDDPAEHWVQIRTTNRIESTFATIRPPTRRSRICGSPDTTAPARRLRGGTATAAKYGAPSFWPLSQAAAPLIAADVSARRAAWPARQALPASTPSLVFEKGHRSDVRVNKHT